MSFALGVLSRTSLFLSAVAICAFAASETSAQREGVTQGDDGKYYTEEGTPTYNVGEDGTVDWYSYQGFRRYHAECHTCHGPDGMGSSFGPALANTLERLDYYEFMDIVVNGRTSGNLVMPGFGENLNVMCYIDDIYIYLKARSDEAIPRGRPAQREDKPQAATEAEDACFGT